MINEGIPVHLTAGEIDRIKQFFKTGAHLIITSGIIRLIRLYYGRKSSGLPSMECVFSTSELLHSTMRGQIFIRQVGILSRYG